MSLMNFRNEANRANAQKSTGPRTEEGKARSRENALKHGLSALIVTPDVDPKEVDEARERWIDCFNPQDEVALTLADMAFRCKRRMESVADAEDAAASLRVREVGTALREETEREYRHQVERFRNEPTEARLRLMATGRGCRWLLDRLEELTERLEAGLWGAEDGRALLGLEGEPADASDCELEAVREMFEECRRAKAAGVPEGMAGEMERTVKGIAEGLRTRLNQAQRGIERRMVHADAELGDVIRLRAEAAKFDPSDEGRLRRRYLIDAQREFLKALAAAQKAAGPKVSPEAAEAAARSEESAGWGEINARVATAESVEVVAEAPVEPKAVVGPSSPNEPRSGRIGRPGGDGRKGRRIPAPRPRPVAPTVRDGVGD